MERKVVLITGGAMGQGKSHALKFAENGFDVVLADMQDPEGETFKQTVAEIEAAGAKALAVRANITSDEDMQNLFEKAWQTFGRIDVVVANAGVINFGYTWELTDAQVQKVIDIDLIGTWRTDKYAALYMRKQGFGRIINISSTSGMYGTPKLATYCMAKWGRPRPDQDPGPGAERHRHRRQHCLPHQGQDPDVRDRQLRAVHQRPDRHELCQLAGNV